MEIENIPQRVKELRRAFRSGKTLPLAWRIQQLKRFLLMLDERGDEFTAALREDLGKSEFEAQTGEVHFLKSEIEFTLKHLEKWLKPEKVTTPLVFQPGQSTIVKEPLGVVLVIGAWNYPIQLTMGPVIGAIAAGNCVLIKPPELAPASSAVLAKWVPRYFDHDSVALIEGGVPETTEILKQKFDHIFFTGSSHVGRIVMQAAAPHLTPVTLELGGKSPCIVDWDVDLQVTARRIVWGKFFNAGQTCVAPDYVLVHKEIEAALLRQLQVAIHRFYGKQIQQSPDFGRIVNDRHFSRLKGLLEGQEISFGGELDQEQRFISPTLIHRVDPESNLMKEEIFGPILPLIVVDSIEEAIEFVDERPKPLALYLFSNRKQIQEQVVLQTSSGGVCINDTIVHMTTPFLPFGGVGESGMGSYHGQKSVDTFCHHKSILNKSTRIDPDLRYPPYSKSKLKWAKRLL